MGYVEGEEDKNTEEKEGSEKNSVVMMIGDIPIKQRNWIQIRLNPEEYARIIRTSLLTGISAARIIALSSQPCPICGNDHIAITIPLSLLSTKKQINGVTKHKNHQTSNKIKP